MTNLTLLFCVFLFSVVRRFSCHEGITPLKEWNTATTSKFHGISNHVPTSLVNGESIEYFVGVRNPTTSHVLYVHAYPGTDTPYWVLTDDWDAKFLNLEAEQRDNSKQARSIKPADRCTQLTQASKAKISASLDPLYRAKSHYTTPIWLTPNEFDASPNTKKLLYCFALSQKAMVCKTLYFFILK